MDSLNVSADSSSCMYSSRGSSRMRMCLPRPWMALCNDSGVAATDELRERLEAFCSERSERPVHIERLARLSGGASRATWSFTVLDGDRQRDLVLRQDPPGAPARADRSMDLE